MSKRTLLIEKEPETAASLIEMCMEIDPWYAIESLLSVVDIMVLRLVSTGWKTFFHACLQKHKGNYFFYFLLACKPCGSQNYLHRCPRTSGQEDYGGLPLGLGGLCKTDRDRVIVRGTQQTYFFKADLIKCINHFKLDEESGDVTIAVSLETPFCPNWRQGVTAVISNYEFIINIKTSKSRVFFSYDGVRRESNGILHGGIYYSDVSAKVAKSDEEVSKLSEEMTLEVAQTRKDLLRPILNHIEDLSISVPVITCNI